LKRRTKVLTLLITFGLVAAFIRVDYAIAYVLAILPSVLDAFGLLEREKEKDEKVNVPSVDYVAIAQAWAKGRLTGIDIERWGSREPEDDGEGGIVVRGVAIRGPMQSMQIYTYYVNMTKEGRVLHEKSSVQ
jgi:hypothetical protein